MSQHDARIVTIIKINEQLVVLLYKQLAQPKQVWNAESHT